MGNRSVDEEAVYAGLAGLGGVTGSFATVGYTRRFVVAPIDRIVVDLSPGFMSAWLIQALGDEAHLIHIGLSIGIATVLFAMTSYIGFVVARRTERTVVGASTAGVLAWGLAGAITLQPVPAIGAAFPVAAFTAAGIAPLPGRVRGVVSRRGFVISSAVGFAGASVIVGSVLSSDDDESPSSGNRVDGAVSDLIETAEARSLEIVSDSVPGLVSTIEEFYTVDITQFPPEIPAADWSMTITGQVGRDLTLTFEDLTAMQTEHRFVTLRCVSDKVNGDLMDTAVWTGTPIRSILEVADPRGRCGCVMLRAGDGYSVQFPVEALEDAFLAWGMNGESLPVEHGFPVRALVPGHWGETNVKWLTEIELLEEAMDGYWERRGWQGTGPVNTVAKLWGVTRLDDGGIELAGHAYAGTRGIDTVEVSIDDGTTWNDATVSEPLPGSDVWRQWRYVFVPDGPHEVVVRAVDGEGNLQLETPTNPFPSGATGWVRQHLDY